jgi:hypothetical protein
MLPCIAQKHPCFTQKHPCFINQTVRSIAQPSLPLHGPGRSARHCAAQESESGPGLEFSEGDALCPHHPPRLRIGIADTGTLAISPSSPRSGWPGGGANACA